MALDTPFKEQWHFAGEKNYLSDNKKVLVIGGGLAGIAAATVLAERKVSVTIVEKEAYLGGRVGGWTDQLSNGENFEMERGFHAFFRQYYNLRNLLRRIDPNLRNLIPLEDYPVLGPEGYMESFKSLPKLPPLNIMELVRRTPTLHLKDLMTIDKKAAMKMLSFDMDKTYEEMDGFSAKEYLDSLNFPPQARRMLFDVFSHSFFNPEDQMSAGELLMMFHFYFLGNHEGLVFDVLKEPFSDALWKPFSRYLEKIGVEILLEKEAKKLTQTKDGQWSVEIGSPKQVLKGDAAVLALHVPGIQTLVNTSPFFKASEWKSNIEQLELTESFAVWRMWLDKQGDADRYPFVGTAGLGIIDNISLYELFEGESNRWCLRNGGSVVEIHAYAVPANYNEKSIKQELKSRLYELYPETKSAKVLEDRFLLKQDCPAFKPGFYSQQPNVETPYKGLTLAGDFVKLPFPSALMERATSSGFMAANLLLKDWNISGETLHTLSKKGILSGFNALL